MARLKLENIPWDALAKLGITKEILEQTNNLENLLNYNKTSLMAIKGKLPNIEITGGHAKLMMRNNEKGEPELRLELVRKYPNLKGAIYGTFLSDAQKQQILDGANVKCNTKNGELSLLVSLDSDTNQLNHVDASKVSIQDKMAGVTLSNEQKDELLKGNSIKLDGMKKKSGETFSARVAYNTVNKTLVFLPEKAKSQTQSKQQSTKKGKSVTS